MAKQLKEPGPDNEGNPTCNCLVPDGIHTAGCSSRSSSLKSTMDGLEAVPRADSIEVPYWMTKAFTVTPEGFLTGRAIVTSIGVFEYKKADGTTQREARMPEDVFCDESLASMKLKPIANGHPAENINAENINKYQIGNMGANPSSRSQWQNNSWGDDDKVTDGLHVAIDLTIQNADGIAAVRNGKVSLSMGYECMLEPAAPGARYLGMPYDYIQRRIRYNHLALVDAARAGDKARITFDRLDGAESIQSLEKGTKQEDLMLKKINLDGVDYEAEAKVIESLTKEKMRADAAEVQVTTLATAKSTLEGERDALKARADGLDVELKAAKADALDPAKLGLAIQSKLDLYSSAEKAGVEVKKDGLYLADLDIKKAVILKASPKAVLDGKDDAYIQGRFDSALEDLGSRSVADTDTSTLLGGGSLPDTKKDGDDAPSAEKSRLAMQARLYGAHKSTEGGK